jgi:hypothetical protein
MAWGEFDRRLNVRPRWGEWATLVRLAHESGTSPSEIVRDTQRWRRSDRVQRVFGLFSTDSPPARPRIFFSSKSIFDFMSACSTR